MRGDGEVYERHLSGKESEYFAAYQLTKLGFDVVIPTGNPRYDLIVEKEAKRYFIQVKSGIMREGSLKINLRGNSDTKGYTSRDIDLFVIHERTSNDLLFLPIEEIEGQVSVCFRYEKPKKIFSHRTRLAQNYMKFPFEKDDAA